MSPGSENLDENKELSDQQNPDMNEQSDPEQSELSSSSGETKGSKSETEEEDEESETLFEFQKEIKQDPSNKDEEAGEEKVENHPQSQGKEAGAISAIQKIINTYKEKLPNQLSFNRQIVATKLANWDTADENRFFDIQMIHILLDRCYNSSTQSLMLIENTLFDFNPSESYNYSRFFFDLVSAAKTSIKRIDLYCRVMHKSLLFDIIKDNSELCYLEIHCDSVVENCFLDRELQSIRETSKNLFYINVIVKDEKSQIKHLNVSEDSSLAIMIRCVFAFDGISEELIELDLSALGLLDEKPEIVTESSNFDNNSSLQEEKSSPDLHIDLHNPTQESPLELHPEEQWLRENNLFEIRHALMFQLQTSDVERLLNSAVQMPFVSEEMLMALLGMPALSVKKRRGWVENNPPVKALLEKVDRKGNTLLMIAAANGSLNAVRFFLLCMNVEKHLAQLNISFLNAVDLAWKKKKYDCVFELLQAGSPFPHQMITVPKENSIFYAVVKSVLLHTCDAKSLKKRKEELFGKNCNQEIFDENFCEIKENVISNFKNDSKWISLIKERLVKVMKTDNFMQKCMEHSSFSKKTKDELEKIKTESITDLTKENVVIIFIAFTELLSGISIETWQLDNELLSWKRQFFGTGPETIMLFDYEGKTKYQQFSIARYYTDPDFREENKNENIEKIHDLVKKRDELRNLIFSKGKKEVIDQIKENLVSPGSHLNADNKSVVQAAFNSKKLGLYATLQSNSFKAAAYPISMYVKDIRPKEPIFEIPIKHFYKADGIIYFKSKVTVDRKRRKIDENDATNVSKLSQVLLNISSLKWVQGSEKILNIGFSTPNQEKRIRLSEDPNEHYIYIDMHAGWEQELNCEITQIANGIRYTKIRGEFVFETLNPLELSTLQQEMKLQLEIPGIDFLLQSYFMDKSRCVSSSGETGAIIQRYFATIIGIEEIKMILEVIMVSGFPLDIMFDFNNTSVREIAVADTETRRGMYEHRHNDSIYIAAGVEENECVGTLAHELTHLGMRLLFRNHCNSYFVNPKDNNDEKTFTDKRNFIRSNCYHDNEVVLDDIIIRVFECYREALQNSELIVRVPHMLAKYGRTVGLIKLRKQVPKLLYYYGHGTFYDNDGMNEPFDGVIMNACKNYVKKNFLEKLQKTLTDSYQKYDQLPHMFEAEGEGKSQPLSEAFIKLTIVKKSKQEEKERNLGDEDGIYYEERRLASYEELYDSKESLEIEELWNAQLNAKKLLILGRAGSGKSVLCRYIATQVHQGKLWSKKFEAVFFLRLRELVNLENSTLADVLLKHCMSSLHPSRLESYLEKKSDKVLFLLDGFDEVNGSESKALKDVLGKISQYQYVIMTSRPQVGTITHLGASRIIFDQTLETVGFTDTQIPQYIANYMKAYVENEQKEGKCYSDSSLIEFLKQRPSLWSMAHTPILLELTCWLWRWIQKSEDELDIHTLTDFYSHVVARLEERDNKKRGNIKPNLEIDRFLRQLAYQGMQEHSIILSAKLIQRVVLSYCGPSEFSVQQTLADEGEKLLTEVVRFGILKPVKHQQNYRDQEYYFIHFTFQEYYAARYVQRGLQDKDNHRLTQKVCQLIRVNKYTPKYQFVWRFTAGLLYQNCRNFQCMELRKFWEIILRQKPLDLAGPTHFALVAYCFEECRADTEIYGLIQTHCAILKQLERWIRVDGWFYGLNKLQNCPNLFQKLLSFDQSTILFCGESWWALPEFAIQPLTHKFSSLTYEQQLIVAQDYGKLIEGHDNYSDLLEACASLFDKMDEKMQSLVCSNLLNRQNQSDKSVRFRLIMHLFSLLPKMKRRIQEEIVRNLLDNFRGKKHNGTDHLICYQLSKQCHLLELKNQRLVILIFYMFYVSSNSKSKLAKRVLESLIDLCENHSKLNDLLAEILKKTPNEKVQMYLPFGEVGKTNYTEEIYKNLSDKEIRELSLVNIPIQKVSNDLRKQIFKKFRDVENLLYGIELTTGNEKSSFFTALQKKLQFCYWLENMFEDKLKNTFAHIKRLGLANVARKTFEKHPSKIRSNSQVCLGYVFFSSPNDLKKSQKLTELVDVIFCKISSFQSDEFISAIYDQGLTKLYSCLSSNEQANLLTKISNSEKNMSLIKSLLSIYAIKGSPKQQIRRIFQKWLKQAKDGKRTTYTLIPSLFKVKGLIEMVKGDAQKTILNILIRENSTIITCLPVVLSKPELEEEKNENVIVMRRSGIIVKVYMTNKEAKAFETQCAEIRKDLDYPALCIENVPNSLSDRHCNASLDPENKSQSADTEQKSKGTNLEDEFEIITSLLSEYKKKLSSENAELNENQVNTLSRIVKDLTKNRKSNS